MNRLSTLRERWDRIFSNDKARVFGIVFSVASAFVSTFALAQLFPFLSIIDNSGMVVVLIAVIIAGAMYINEYLGVVLFGIVMLAALPAGQAAVAFFASILVIIVCGNSRFICGLAIIVPFLSMNVQETGNPLISVGVSYFIFFVCVYFNGKIANKTWKYCFPIYYSLVAYNFGLYGTIEDKYIKHWDVNITKAENFSSFNYFVDSSNFDEAFATLDYLNLVTIILINFVICCIVYKLLNMKSVKYLSVQLDIRDAIVFASGTVLVAAGTMGINNLCETGNGIDYSIIIQGLAAYLITRPLASFGICNALGNKQTDYERKNAIDSQAYERTAKEEIHNIIEMYASRRKFNNILEADKNPINCMLIYSNAGVAPGLVVLNSLKNESFETAYLRGSEVLDVYEETGAFEILNQPNTSDKLKIIVIENIDELVCAGDPDEQETKAMMKAFFEILSSYGKSNKMLFIFTTERPDLLPEELYGDGCIGKVIFGKRQDSILLNNTYRLMKAIGEGGAGRVYRGFHERLEAPVVVKQLTDSITGMKSYKTEANVLKNLKHTYIPKVYDVFMEEGNYYTVMDYVPGRDMAAEIAISGRLDTAKAVKWGCQLIEAVEYLHEQEPPIIHSDIKPGNIMVTPEGNISLIDFNISLIFSKNNKSIGVTPGYSPIEQYGSFERYSAVADATRVLDLDENSTVHPKDIEKYTTVFAADKTRSANNESATTGIGNKELKKYAGSGLSERSDIYSIGATLYTMVTGKAAPIDMLCKESIFDEIQAEGLRKIIAKAMSLEPENRYQTAAEMLEALRNT